MMDANLPQVDILRAFPGYTFKSLAVRYAYHGTPDNSYARYQGERPYTLGTRWEDTEEYRQEQQAEDEDLPEPSESSERLFSISSTVP